MDVGMGSLCRWLCDVRAGSDIRPADIKGHPGVGNRDPSPSWRQTVWNHEEELILRVKEVRSASSWALLGRALWEGPRSRQLSPPSPVDWAGCHLASASTPSREKRCPERRPQKFLQRGESTAQDQWDPRLR